MRQYTNENGITFGIIDTEYCTMAYINGKYVTQTESENELVEILKNYEM